MAEDSITKKPIQAASDPLSLDDVKTLREQLADAHKKLARMEERDLMRDVRERAFTIIELKAAKLPAITRGRLRKQFNALMDPPLKENGTEVDLQKLDEMIVDAIKEEAVYLRSTGALPSGVHSAGGDDIMASLEPPSEDVLDKQFEESLVRTGHLNGDAAKIAAKGRR